MLDRPHPTPAVPSADPFALAKALSGLHFIGGAYVPARSGKSFAVVNPATGIEVARAAEGDAHYGVWESNINAILPDGEGYSDYAGDCYMRGLICRLSPAADP